MFCPLMLVTMCVISTKGKNIMLNKPSSQSSTWSDYWLSSNANDGTKSTLPSHTKTGLDHYWQGDLLGFYIVHNISVSSDDSVQAAHLKEAFVGVSVHDVTCSNSVVTKCGQWPDQNLPGQTLVFNCSQAGPVRFVRVWRNLEVQDELAIDEVEVEGKSNKPPEGSVYDKVAMKKLNSPTMSLSVPRATDCGTMCLNTQPCLAFSYSPFQQPNCLLATEVTMTTDQDWVSYTIQKCFIRPTCN